MFNFKNKIDRKYFVIELIFFVFICFISPIISDLEFSYYEQNNVLRFAESVEARLVWGTYSFAFYTIYYWVFLKGYVFKKRIFPIIISICFFIILSHLYDKYIMNYTISKFSFLSDEMQARALKDFNKTKLYFIISYILNRILFTIVGFAFLIRSLQQDEQMSVLNEQKLISELAYLKAQLQPHFFFNTLNNIYALALKKSDNTAPLVAKLSEMMRYILYKSESKLVLLESEINFIENYIEVERVRYPCLIKIDFEFQGIDSYSQIGPLLLLPFIENAFKHGVQEETKEGFVHLLICKMESELIMELSNSISSKKANDFVGIGLINVRKRLDIQYPNRYNLEQINNGKVYQMRLTLLLG
ncbi:sensor histidine kinase [Pedobacter jamesrossensis]|uniref:Sensor histidine kinase n=1 Tax=Pedobacter jamesrossensis TaxID=1908238 RepID=A0ABV8NRR3_9SPHI